MNPNPIKDQNSKLYLNAIPSLNTLQRYFKFLKEQIFLAQSMPQWVKQQTKIIENMNTDPKRHHRDQELLISPSAIFSSLIADLQRAHETIDMEYYIFANDRTGRLFADILRRKARQGLRVRLIVDGYGSFALSGAMRRALQHDGVELQCHTLLSHSRYHRKMAIIDNRIAHVGGINIADRYVVGNTLGKWHDVQLRLVGEVVHAVSRLYDYDYMASEGLKCEVPMLYNGGGVQVVWSESRGRRAMYNLLNDVVCSAEHAITFTTPYFLPPRSVMHHLARTVARGVVVTLIVPECCDVWLLDQVMRRRLAEAVRLGVDVRICRRAFLHAKLAIVDGERVVVGSANLDSRSLYHNREIMVATDSRRVVDSAESFVRDMLDRSTVPTKRDMRSFIPSIVSRCFEGLL